uniref:Protein DETOXIFICATION n=1 Tax=Oryza barthii TaxID=65489 RepID=A0A0D3HCI1_9ORYZ
MDEPTVEEPLLAVRRGGDGTAAEVKRLLRLAGPLMAGFVLRNSVQMVSVMFVGHLGELQLAGSSLAASLASVTGFSLLSGMSSALDTLCGQAYGAGQHRLLGVYAQRAMLVLAAAAVPIALVWASAGEILLLFGQDPAIAAEAGAYARWMIPSLAAYVPLTCALRFLQAQGIVVPVMASSGVAAVAHVAVCWALVHKAGMGSKGAALSGAVTYWTNFAVLAFYARLSGACKTTWTGFSMDAFRELRRFTELAVPSAMMVCLEWSSFEILVLLSGILPNPQLETAVLSISLSTASLLIMVPRGIGSSLRTCKNVKNSDSLLDFLTELTAAAPAGSGSAVGSVRPVVVADRRIYCPTSYSSSSSLPPRSVGGNAFLLPPPRGVGGKEARRTGRRNGGAGCDTPILKNHKYTRVSNELGGGHPRAARMAARVATAMTVLVCLVLVIAMILLRNVWGYAYSSEEEVVAYIASMLPILAVSFFVDGINGALSGVLTGCGKQKIGAHVNLGAFYLVGIPTAVLLAFVLHLNGEGLWLGIVCGSISKVGMLLFITLHTDWGKEVQKASPCKYFGYHGERKGLRFKYSNSMKNSRNVDPVSNIITNAVGHLPPPANVMAQWSLKALVGFLICYFYYMPSLEALCYLCSTEADILTIVHLIEIDCCTRTFGVGSGTTKTSPNCATGDAGHANMDSVTTAMLTLSLRLRKIAGLLSTETVGDSIDMDEPTVEEPLLAIRRGGDGEDEAMATAAAAAAEVKRLLRLAGP